MEVFSADRVFRATIADGGEVRTGAGLCVGYINEDGSAGDAYGYFGSPFVHDIRNENFLGEISGDQVIDSNDNIVGSINFGTGELRDEHSYWGKVIAGGEITDRLDGFRGKVGLSIRLCSHT
jgi:hypothetical protein